MVFSTYTERLKRADELLRSGAATLPGALDGVPLDVFGALYLDGCREYPALQDALPPMPSADVQQSWTGSEGHALMSQSCAFVKAVVTQYERTVGTVIEDGVVLDYGCGWGRLSRLMMRYVPAARIWALDPWPEAIDLCRKLGLRVNLRLCDEVPTALPLDGTQPDLVIAFSVFTHLSRRCGEAVLGALHRHLRPGGPLAITIRPAEYWDIHVQFPPGIDRRFPIRDHHDRGFAFVPHQRPPIDGDVTFGDASMSLSYIEEHWRNWRILTTDFNLVDPYQVIVYLTPR